MSLTDGIVGCWSPSVRGSGYLLPDLARGNHGVLQNMEPTDWEAHAVFGQSGRALSYDGSNEYTTIATSPLRNRTVLRLSSAAWVRLTGSFYGLVWLSNGTTGVIWYAGTSAISGQLLFAGAGTGVASTTALPQSRWCHIGWSYSERSVAFYFNGRPDGTATVSGAGNPSFSTVALNLGGYGGGESWPGQQGELAIWDRVVTGPEFAEIYRQGNGAIGRQLTGQTRRRVYGFVPAGFRAYWARRQNQIIGGGV